MKLKGFGFDLAWLGMLIAMLGATIGIRFDSFLLSVVIIGASYIIGRWLVNKNFAKQESEGK